MYENYKIVNFVIEKIKFSKFTKKRVWVTLNRFT